MQGFDLADVGHDLHVRPEQLPELDASHHSDQLCLLFVGQCLVLCEKWCLLVENLNLSRTCLCVTIILFTQVAESREVLVLKLQVVKLNLLTLLFALEEV